MDKICNSRILILTISCHSSRFLVRGNWTNKKTNGNSRIAAFGTEVKKSNEVKNCQIEIGKVHHMFSYYFLFYCTKKVLKSAQNIFFTICQN